MGMDRRGSEDQITGCHGNMASCRWSNDGLDCPCFFLNIWTLAKSKNVEMGYHSKRRGEGECAWGQLLLFYLFLFMVLFLLNFVFCLWISFLSDQYIKSAMSNSNAENLFDVIYIFFFQCSVLN